MFRKLIIHIFVFSIYGFLIISLSGCGIQTRLLYHPGQFDIEEIKQKARETGLQLWPVQNKNYQGIISKQGPAKFKGTVVVFHGNAGTAISRKYYIDALEIRGYRVVLAEFPGYGGRTGELSEKSFVKDARSTVLDAKNDFGEPLFIWGESMGCGVASALAKDLEFKPKGIVMLTPWDSLLNIGKIKFPWLPVKFLLHDTYDNIENMVGYKGQVAVIMCKKDNIIPNRLTLSLYDSVSHPKQIWVFENAGHNSWPSNIELDWWDEVMNFLNSGE